jgi:hypothetical protein
MVSPKIAPNVHVLGSDVEIDVLAFDETNTRIRCDRLAAMIQVAGAGMVMLVGVQSNQFPRALDLAKALRARNIMVAIGGFHVSGTVSMLKGVDRDLECRSCRMLPPEHSNLCVPRTPCLLIA